MREGGVLFLPLAGGGQSPQKMSVAPCSMPKFSSRALGPREAPRPVSHTLMGPQALVPMETGPARDAATR